MNTETEQSRIDFEAHPIQIDERAEFVKEFPAPEGLEYCPDRGIYVWRRDYLASTAEHSRVQYAYNAALAAWKRRAWKRNVLDVPQEPAASQHGKSANLSTELPGNSDDLSTKQQPGKPIGVEVKPVLQWSDDGACWMDGAPHEMASARAAGYATRTLYTQPLPEPRLEPVAEDERKKAIDEISEAINRMPYTRTHLAEYLYDAGYRKQVAR